MMTRQCFQHDPGGEADLSPEPEDLIRSPLTKWIHLELTSRCNLRCVYCLKSTHSQEGQRIYDLPLDQLDGLLAVLLPRGLSHVHLSGIGETTVRQGWEKTARSLLAAGIPCAITTNLAKSLSDAEVETFSEFLSIEVSLETTVPDLFGKIRRGAKLETLLDNLERIRAAAQRKNIKGPEFRAAMTINDKVVHHLPQTVSTCISCGFTYFFLANLRKTADVPNALNVYPLSWMAPADRPSAYERIDEAIELMQAQGLEFRVEHELTDPVERPFAAGGIRLPQAETGVTRNCTDPWDYAMLGADGIVHPCCLRERPLGNFLDTPLADILNGPEAQQIRKELLTGRLKGPCRKCQRMAVVPITAFRQRIRRLLEEASHPESRVMCAESSAVVAQWQKEGRSVMIYPAGRYTEWIMSSKPKVFPKLVGFADRDPSRVGTTLAGLPVLDPKDMLALNPTAILIASPRFADEIYNSLKHLEARGIAIHKAAPP